MLYSKPIKAPTFSLNEILKNVFADGPYPEENNTYMRLSLKDDPQDVSRQRCNDTNKQKTFRKENWGVVDLVDQNICRVCTLYNIQLSEALF